MYMMKPIKRLAIVGGVLLAAVWLALMGQVGWAAEQDVLALTADKTADRAEVLPGSLVHYTVTVENTGAGFPMVSITDTLPAELTLISASISGGLVVTTGNMITATASLNPDDSVMIYYTAQVTDTAVAGWLITNTVEIAGNDASYMTRTATVEVITATADYSGSSKTANRDTARRGQTVHYTVVISNSGNLDDSVTVTDTLPAHLTLTGTPTSNGGGTFETTGNTLVWTGTVTGYTAVTLGYHATVANSAPIGAELVNTAAIVGTGASADASYTVTVITSASKVYLPLITVPDIELPELVLSATRPNSNNHWTLSWTPHNGMFTYEIQESQTADFAAVATLNAGSAASHLVERLPSYNNEYFYRARAVYGDETGPWSNVVNVIGGFYDDFTNPANEWPTRRTTYLEKIGAIHDNNQLLLRVDDRWDWGIFSPLKKAPSLPYVIEYEATIAHFANLTTHGAVFGGDWNGTAPCFDDSTFDGIYKHTDCFNHFYNTNIIWYGGAKMLFERVDYLYWCFPDCIGGGAPMKRLGNDYGAWFESPFGTNMNPNGTNTYRIEVRADGARMFVNGSQYAQSYDSTWVNDPYFGLFASTDEYKPSEWRVNYYRVLPLD
jgi:uncharacterized repeat protein (TIGR01451 family)